MVKNEGGVTNYLYNMHSMKSQAQRKQRKRWEDAKQEEIQMEKANNKNKVSELLFEQKLKL